MGGYPQLLVELAVGFRGGGSWTKLLEGYR